MRACLLRTTGGADAPGAVVALEGWPRPYEELFLLPFLSPRHVAREISSALSFRSDPSGSLTSTICWCGKHCPGSWLERGHLLRRKGSSPHRPWRFLLEPSPASPRYLKNMLVIFRVQHSRDGCQGNARLNLHGHQRVCKLGAKTGVSARFPINWGQRVLQPCCPG